MLSRFLNTRKRCSSTIKRIRLVEGVGRWMKNKRIAQASVLLLLLLNPLSVNVLESNMTLYMLVQIPGLTACGCLYGSVLRPRLPSWCSELDKSGIAGLLTAVFTIGYWILPRSVDAAINMPEVDALKFISLVLLAGIPLGISWPRTHALTRGIVWANVIAMLLVMSWLYLSAPVRLCNNFLAEQQQFLGKSMMAVGFTVAVYFIIRVFAGKSVETADPSAREH